MTFFKSSSRPIFLFEHDLFGKPVPTFPDHAPEFGGEAVSFEAASFALPLHQYPAQGQMLAQAADFRGLAPT
jgi:hypothetical protein